jgi:hypothetical protein
MATCRRTLKQIGEDVRTCATLTLLVAAGFVAYALLLFLIRGHAPFDANGTTLPAVMLAYLFGGILSGVSLGLFLPIGRTRAGAMLLGVLAVFPMYQAAGFAIVGFGSWSWDEVIISIVAAVPTGSFLGWMAHWYLRG